MGGSACFKKSQVVMLHFLTAIQKVFYHFAPFTGQSQTIQSFSFLQSSWYTAIWRLDALSQGSHTINMDAFWYDLNLIAAYEVLKFYFKPE